METTQLWKKKDVADFLNISQRSVDNYIADRAIPFIPFGGNVRFSPEQIVRWLNERVIVPVQVPKRNPRVTSPRV